jgi:tetratricopeptide (TPR) repeat protein
VSPSRFIRPVLLTACVLALAIGLTVAAAVLRGGRPGSGSSTALPASTMPATAVPSLQVLQAQLRAHPRDAQGWAGLGLAYVEQARISADPTYYPKADRALARAERLAPTAALTLVGQATLAAARHDFAGALRRADQAIAVDPFSAQAFAVRADALTELGRYGPARTAAAEADDLRPGSSTFARLSYAAELRGNLTRASSLMKDAQDAATSPSSFAFAAFHLGELSRAAGQPRAAAAHYAAALAAAPGYAPALAGRARLAVARGDLAAAERDYTQVVQRLPLTEYVVELGELYAATRRPQLAEQQWSVARASAVLATANGVVTDLDTALFEADHGSPVKAVAAAHAEWDRRRSIHVADALGWALHAAGKDRAALRHARFATSLGTQDARLLFHRGVIEAALGHDADGRRHLRAALRLDDGVSPFREQQAQRLLARLGGPR